MNNITSHHPNINVGSNAQLISYYAKFNSVSCYDGTLAIVTPEGSVQAYGKSYNNSIADVRNWTEIISVVVLPYCILGLKEDGTMVGAGILKKYEACLQWHGVVSLKAKDSEVYCLTESGDLLYASYKDSGIVAHNVVFADYSNTYGYLTINTDHSIFFTGSGEKSRHYNTLRYYEEFSNHLFTEAYFWHGCIVGLADDGNVLQFDYDRNVECWYAKVMDPSIWNDIFHLYVDDGRMFGIKKSGSVVYTFGSYTLDWRLHKHAYYKQIIPLKNVLSIYCNERCFIGITEEGNLIWSGYDLNGNLIPDNNAMPSTDGDDYTFFALVNIKVFDDIKSILYRSTHIDEIIISKRQMKEEEITRIAEENKRKQQEFEEHQRKERELLQGQYRSLGVCQHCGKKFKGLFSKTCSSCGRPKDY